MARYCTKCGETLSNCKCIKDAVIEKIEEEKEKYKEKEEIKEEVKETKKDVLDKIDEVMTKVREEQVEEKEEDFITDKKELKVKKELKEVEHEDLLTRFLNIVEGMFKEPVNTINKYSYTINTYIYSIIMLIVTPIMFGLYGQSIFSNTKKLFEEAIVDDVVFNIENFMNTTLKESYFPDLVITFFLMNVSIIAVLYIMQKYVYKKKTDLKKCITLLGVAITPLFIGTLISTIVSIKFIPLSILVYLVFFIIYLSNIHISLDEVTKLDKEQSIITTTILSLIPTIFIGLLVLFIFIFIAYMMITNNVSIKDLGL